MAHENEGRGRGSLIEGYYPLVTSNLRYLPPKGIEEVSTGELPLSEVNCGYWRGNSAIMGVAVSTSNL